MMSNRRVTGFTLIEVLVALFVLAIGVMGAAAMQLNALKFNQTASMRSQATLLAYEIGDSMRANRAKAIAGSYNIEIDAQTPSGSSVEASDLKSWLQALSERLPSGKGSVVQDAANDHVFTITVQWDESRLGLEDDADTPQDETLTSFVFVTQL